MIKDELSPIDMEVAKKTGIELWKIGFVDETITLERYNGDESCSIEEFVKKNNLKEKIHMRHFKRQEKNIKKKNSIAADWLRIIV